MKFSKNTLKKEKKIKFLCSCPNSRTSAKGSYTHSTQTGGRQHVDMTGTKTQRQVSEGAIQRHLNCALLFLGQKSKLPLFTWQCVIFVTATMQNK